MSGAAEALVAATVEVLSAVPGTGGVYDGVPVQAVFPHVVVEAGLESDWGTKSGAGRELRLAVTIRDKSERPRRLRRLMADAESALAGLPSLIGGWRLVSLTLLRSRTAAERGGGWAGLIEVRARMLAD